MLMFEMGFATCHVTPGAQGAEAGQPRDGRDHRHHRRGPLRRRLRPAPRQGPGGGSVVPLPVRGGLRLR